MGIGSKNKRRSKSNATQIEVRGDKKFDDVNRNNVNRDDVNRRITLHTIYIYIYHYLARVTGKS